MRNSTQVDLRAQIIIPTFNAENNIDTLLDSIYKQTSVQIEVLIIDSESSDSTMEIVKIYDCQINKIEKRSFNHGGTRQMGIEICSAAEFIIFLTQDVILSDEYAIKNILKYFEDKSIGCAYGRQLPHKKAGIIAAHARLFNYPTKSRVKTLKDAGELGIKTAFISNSFAAYRRKALVGVGGFPKHTILSEDTYVAAKMILSGWKSAYCADATAYHSHDYSYTQEFKRYFDIGVFYSREKWIRERFGQAEGEGMKFVISEICYIWNNSSAYLLFSVLLRTSLKYIGYKMGINEMKLPIQVKKFLSMHASYWEK